MIDILQAYIDLGVMMQKPSAGNEKQLKQHYKVHDMHDNMTCIMYSRMRVCALIVTEAIICSHIVKN